MYNPNQNKPTASVFLLFLLLALLVCSPAGAVGQALPGDIGCSEQFGSCWLDLTSPHNFGAGDTLKIRVGNSAQFILVRLLPQGSGPGSTDGLINDKYKVPNSGVVVVPLSQAHQKVCQISVHGGAAPFGINLTGNNGPAQLYEVILIQGSIPGDIHVPDTKSGETLAGSIGSDPRYKSSWLDLNTPMSFNTGDTLNVSLAGTATEILLRLLPVGADPGSSTGMIWITLPVPGNRIVSFTLQQNYSNIGQISVHGGSKAFNYKLADNNGDAIIISVKLVRAGQ